MKNFLDNKDHHQTAFGAAVYRAYRKQRYGLSPCVKDDMDLLGMRKELTDWQERCDNMALSTTTIQYKGWLPVSYTLGDGSVYQPGMVCSSTGSPAPASITVGSGNPGDPNLIQVNTGGCITRIELTPTVNITNNNSNVYNTTNVSNRGYVHTQTTPALQWVIEHNLGIVPNVTIEDSDGNDLTGAIVADGLSRILINFNQPKAGKAYLS